MARVAAIAVLTVFLALGISRIAFGGALPVSSLLEVELEDSQLVYPAEIFFRKSDAFAARLELKGVDLGNEDWEGDQSEVSLPKKYLVSGSEVKRLRRLLALGSRNQYYLEHRLSSDRLTIIKEPITLKKPLSSIRFNLKTGEISLQKEIRASVFRHTNLDRHPYWADLAPIGGVRVMKVDELVPLAQLKLGVRRLKVGYGYAIQFKTGPSESYWMPVRLSELRRRTAIVYFESGPAKLRATRYRIDQRALSELSQVAYAQLLVQYERIPLGIRAILQGHFANLDLSVPAGSDGDRVQRLPCRVTLEQASKGESEDEDYDGQRPYHRF